ncbi:MAG: PAS domain S-box protein [Candidatus Omnitrophica bacterium]|nr:PAS domain S-box protein [Candidatus Omnitrophota bacterium]
MKFAAKFTVLVVSIVFVSAVVLSSLVYFSNVRMLECQIVDKLAFRAATIIEIIDRFMYERKIDLRSFSVRLAMILGGSNPDKIRQDLINYRNENKNYISLSYLDLDGKRIADTSGIDIGEQHSLFVQSEYWREILKGAPSIAQLAGYSYSLRIPVIFFAYPVYLEGKMTGVLVGRVATSKLYEITRLAIGIGNNAQPLKIDLVDKQGLLLYSNHNRYGILKDRLRHYAIAQNILSGEKIIAGKCKIHKEYFEVIATEKGFIDFTGNSWSVILAIPAKIVFAPANELKNRMMGFLLFVVILSFLITLIFSHYFSQPIIKLGRAATQISDGNLNTQVEIGSKDEIGQLSVSFNSMVKNLKKAREELVSAKDYTDSIISSMVDCLVIISPAFSIKGVNRALCDLLGYREAELIGQPIKNIFAQEEGEEGEVLLKCFQKITDEGVMHNIGLTFLTKQGKKIPINFSGSLMQKDGQIIAIVGVARDMRQIMAIISDLERKESDLKEQSKSLTRMQRAMLHIMIDLQEASRVKTQFTSMVSHELRTPLASIKEGISLVLDKITGNINDEQTKYLTIAKKNVDRLDRLIVEILDFQKLESGKIEFKIENNDINEIIKGIQNAMEPLFKKRNLTFELRLDDKLPQVQCDHDKIIEVLANLVNNALKFTDKGGVVIATSKAGDFVQVMVKDTGIGIKEESLPKLFQEFTQLHAGREGAGLGLSICKKIIEVHKGKIWAEPKSISEVGLPAGEVSESAKGTAFYFTLPIKKGVV